MKKKRTSSRSNELDGNAANKILKARTDIDEETHLQKQIADQKRAAKAKATVMVNLDAETFGMFTAAGVIHNCTAREAIEKFLNNSGVVCEWSSEGYPI